MMKKLTKSERSWILYDWANSAHSTIILVAIFPLWFGQLTKEAGLGKTETTFWLGTANTISSLIMAFSGGFLGTISDFRGMRMKIFLIFWLLGVGTTFLLIFPGPQTWLWAIVLYVLTLIGFGGANVSYDASLNDVTEPSRADMVSALGFGYGYIGGSTIPFLISLGAIAILSGMNLSGGLPPAGVRFSFILTGLWWLLFSIPYLGNVKQTNGIAPVSCPFRESWRRLFNTLKKVGKHKEIFLFLLAYFFYIDGVNTIIKMATNFASSIGLSTLILLGTLVGIQILAFPFTLLYGRLAELVGAKKMLFIGIGIYIIVTCLGIVMPLVNEKHVTLIFLFVGFLVATSQGGIQALSRSYFATLIPDKDSSGEFFGFYNTMGKFAAIIGPFLMGVMPGIAMSLGLANEKNSYSFAPGIILLIFLTGTLLLIASIRSRKQKQHPREE